MDSNNVDEMSVGCDFPGGNIIVDSISGDTITVHQDLRDTTEDWFYWYFRVRHPAGRTLTIQFTQGPAIGVHGPAVSDDGGRSWRWLGQQAVAGAAFRYSCPPDSEDVRFSVTVPYLEADLQTFLQRHTASAHLAVRSLCRSEKGRDVELVYLGRLDGKAACRVLLIARQHACESMSSYSLEGLMEMLLTDPEEGRWLREQVEFAIVPFMDKDGVEEGDQGKLRSPHDHYVDYGADSIYAAVRALRQLASDWGQDRLRVALDLHCPYLSGPGHEDIFFVGSPGQHNWLQVERFSNALQETSRGPLPFDARHNLPFGESWNIDAPEERVHCRFDWWASSLPGMLLATGVEIPYANASGTIVTPATARAFGHDLARALRIYLGDL